MNSISQFFSGGMPNLPGPLGNITNWLSKLTQFARNPIGAIMGMRNVNVPQNFNGSSQDLVNYLRNSGQMSDQQFQQFAQTANQLENVLPKFWYRT